MMSKISMIPVDQIRPNPFQPRETFDREKILELAASMKESGLIQPILVRKQGKTFQIIAGERRWRAFQFAELKEIPCVIIKADDLESMELSLAENWHRLNLETNESENFIASLYEQGKKAGRYGSLRDMQKKTGIHGSTLQQIISAHRDRSKLGVDTKVTYQDIIKTIPLEQDPELRKHVLRLREKGEIRSADLREFSKTVREASSPVKDALLCSAITINEAKIIESELITPREKERVIKYIESERSADRISFHINFIKQVEERKEIEAEYIETATGDVWICPICNKKYRLTHVDPVGTHRFEEVNE